MTIIDGDALANSPLPPDPTSAAPHRRRLPDERKAITHQFSIAGHEGYLTMGLYNDGTLGEIFLTMVKEGSTISGLMDAFATSVSLSLQYGVPLEVLVEKFGHTRFEPAGYTKNSEIPSAQSTVDYIFRYLASRFLVAEKPPVGGIVADIDWLDSRPFRSSSPTELPEAPNCGECEKIDHVVKMVRKDTFFCCPMCGTAAPLNSTN